MNSALSDSDYAPSVISLSSAVSSVNGRTRKSKDPLEFSLGSSHLIVETKEVKQLTLRRKSTSHIGPQITLNQDQYTQDFLATKSLVDAISDGLRSDSSDQALRWWKSDDVSRWEPVYVVKNDNNLESCVVIRATGETVILTGREMQLRIQPPVREMTREAIVRSLIPSVKVLMNQTRRNNGVWMYLTLDESVYDWYKVQIRALSPIIDKRGNYWLNIEWEKEHESQIITGRTCIQPLELMLSIQQIILTGSEPLPDFSHSFESTIVSKKIEAQKDKIESLETKLERYKELHREAQEEIRKLQYRVEQVRTENDEILESVQQLQEQNRILTQKIKDYKLDVANLKSHPDYEDKYRRCKESYKEFKKKSKEQIDFLQKEIEKSKQLLHQHGVPTPKSPSVGPFFPFSPPPSQRKYPRTSKLLEMFEEIRDEKFQNCMTYLEDDEKVDSTERLDFLFDVFVFVHRFYVKKHDDLFQALLEYCQPDMLVSSFEAIFLRTFQENWEVFLDFETLRTTYYDEFREQSYSPMQLKHDILLSYLENSGRLCWCACLSRNPRIKFEPLDLNLLKQRRDEFGPESLQYVLPEIVPVRDGARTDSEDFSGAVVVMPNGDEMADAVVETVR